MLKQINKSATFSWAPLASQPGFLAAGTAAGTVDNAFDFTSTLEIFDVRRPEDNLQPLGAINCPDRFNKLVWSSLGSLPFGLIAGGMSNGTVTLWNPAKILAREEGALITTVERHTSSVQALDFNPSQPNLLASGASEIFVWDLNNPANPTIYSPGPTASKTPDTVTCVAWHKTVAHIVASSLNNGSCVIWDLKNKRSVLNFVDPNRRQTRWRAVAWNPEEATQLISASDDDACPVLSVWDLRMTYAPSRYLEGHQKGIWAMSWCDHDSNLLLSCGRDNKTLCWNASTGQIIDEIERELPTHWNFDVQWSPKLPATLATSSLDGKIEILSVPDLNPTRTQVSYDPFNPVPAPKPLGPPPKWLKRPCGSSFGWGGQLVSFTPSKRHITITKIGSEPETAHRADRLEQVVVTEEYKSFAEEKLASARTEEEKSTWAFIKVFVEKHNSRRDLLAYLGFEPSEIAEKVKQFMQTLPGDEKEDVPVASEEPAPIEVAGGENKDLSGLFTGDSSANLFDAVQSNATPIPPAVPLLRNLKLFAGDATENTIAQALLVGDFESAVAACIKAGRVADGLVLASVAPAQSGLWERTRETYFQKQTAPFMKVVHSIAKGHLEELIAQLDISQWREILALLCTYAKKEEFDQLCDRLAQHLEQSGDTQSATLCYICAANVDKVIEAWAAQSKQHPRPHEALQDLMDQLVLLVAVGQTPITPTIAEKYCNYSEVLASQGKFSSAQTFLQILKNANYTSDTVQYLFDRVAHALPAPAPAPAPAPVAAPAPASIPATNQYTGYAANLYGQVATGGGYSPNNYGNTNTAASYQYPNYSTTHTMTAPQTMAAPTNTGGVNIFTPAPPPTSFYNPPTSTPPPPSVPSVSNQTAKSMSSPLPPTPTPTPTPASLPPTSSTPGVGIYTPAPPSSGAAPPPLSGSQTNIYTPHPPASSTSGPQTNFYTPHPPSTGPATAGGPIPTPGSAAAVAAAPAPPKPEPEAPLPEATGEAKLVIDSFTAVLGRYPQDPKKKDIETRLQPLFIKLRKGEISEDRIGLLAQLGQALLNNDHQTANHIIPLVAKAAPPQIGSAELIGIKNLKRFTEQR